MIKQFSNYAIDHGLKPTFQLQSEGHKHDTILFDKNGLHFVFLYNKDKDPNYFELVLLYIDDYDPSNTQQFNLLMQLLKDYKVGKVFVTQQNRVTLTFEQYVFSYDNIEKLFDHAIGCLESMIMEYRHSMATIRNQQS